MAIEQFANTSESTLNGGIDGSVTSLIVTNAVTFPASPQFRIRIDNEIMLVTGVASNTFTVTRGAEGTTPAAHTDLTPVVHVLTKAAREKWREDNVGSDVIANRPAAGASGRLFLPTEGVQMMRDTGSVWQGYGPLYKFKAPPTVSNWTWINQETATATDRDGTIVMSTEDTQSSTTSDVRALVKAVPSTPYVVTAAFQAFFPSAAAYETNNVDFGLVWRQSSDGKLYQGARCMWVNATSAIKFDAVTRTDHNTEQLLVIAAQFWHPEPFVFWLRLSDDGVDKKGFVSHNGLDWNEILSTGHATFLTPDQIGFCMNFQTTASTALVAYMNLLSWEES